MSFVIFVDFESLTKPVEIQRCNTHAYQEHELCAYAFKILSTDVKYTQLMKLYRGKNAVVHFLKSLKIEFRTKGLFGLMQKGNDMIMTKEDQILFEKATHCHICEKELDSDKVRDHDHISGKFRGAAHDKCNLNYHPPHRIPIIIHNLRSYDSHLIVKAPGEFPKDKITCIANNQDKYISFSLGTFIFLDSLQFMNATLSSLVNNLRNSGSNFKHLSTEYNNTELLTRKGVYPYDYMDS